MKKIFKLFFGKFLSFGIILILFSSILEICFGEYFAGHVISNCLSTIGVALLLGSIFDFSKNTDEFISFISNIIKRTMITKDFLESLTDEEKKKVLEMVVVPTNSQLEQYSSINNYYRKSIDSFIDLGNRPFKTNITINIIAKMENNCVVCEGNVSYRRYKVGDKYEPIETSFQKSECQMINNYILLPDGTRFDLKENDIKDCDSDVLQKEKKCKKYLTVIPDEFDKYPYITLCKQIKEVGYDHWTVFNWTSLTPCDGLNFELYCMDGLTIKEHKVFDNPKLYEVNLSEKKDRINIISNSWLNEYTGFALTISK